MPTIVFKDATGYSRDERGTVEPRTWSAEVCGFLIVVTKHIDYGKEWTFRCSELGLNYLRALGTEDLEEAKTIAIDQAQDIAEKAVGKLNAFISACYGVEQ